jgi:uroporphyrinogen-III synthase
MIRVLNTRPVGQNQELSQLLVQAGFKAVEIPLVDILPLEDGLRKILRLQPSGYTGIFLSSPNGLRQMQAGLDEDFEKWLNKPFYLVGGKTKAMVEKLGGSVAFFPQVASVAGFLQEYPLESIASGQKGGMVFAQRWLHPCSASTRVDPDAFKKCGVVIENVPVYRPDLPNEAAPKLIDECPQAAAAIFCSGSAVENFYKAAPDQAAKLGHPKFMAISIGPSTSEVLRAKGVEKIYESITADSAGLIDALRSAIGGSETQVLKKKMETKT